MDTIDQELEELNKEVTCAVACPSSELWQDQAGHTHSSEVCEEQLLNTETRVTAVHTWIPEPEDSVAKATAFTILQC